MAGMLATCHTAPLTHTGDVAMRSKRSPTVPASLPLAVGGLSGLGAGVLLAGGVGLSAIGAREDFFFF